MQLIRFESFIENADDSQRLEDLDKEVASMERTVDSMRRKVASMTGSGGRSYRSSYGNRSQQQRRAQALLLSQYEQELRQKRGEAARLRRELETPRQIIHGHRGDNVIVILRTTNDLSAVLSRIDAGGYLTWEGRRMSFDGTTEEWVVSTIQKYDPPR